MYFYVPLHVLDSNMFITHMHAILRSILYMLVHLYMQHITYISKIDRKCYIQSCVLMSLQSSQLSYSTMIDSQTIMCTHVYYMHACMQPDTQTRTQFCRKQRCKHIHSQKQTELVRDMGPYVHMGLFACIIYIHIKSWIG